jgi:hypothetical protein
MKFQVVSFKMIHDHEISNFVSIGVKKKTLIKWKLFAKFTGCEHRVGNVGITDRYTHAVLIVLEAGWARWGGHVRTGRLIRRTRGQVAQERVGTGRSGRLAVARATITVIQPVRVVQVILARLIRHNTLCCFGYVFFFYLMFPNLKWKSRFWIKNRRFFFLN